jgi:hypothetical protein
MSIQKNLVARRAVLLSMIVASSAFSADIGYLSGHGDQRVSDHEHVIITGEIVGGDTDKLRKALTQLTPDPSHRVNPIVILDSPGGNVPIALEMGRSLRDSSAWTIVDRGGSCSSSCVFLLAGGVRRSVFSNVARSDARCVDWNGDHRNAARILSRRARTISPLRSNRTGSTRVRSCLAGCVTHASPLIRFVTGRSATAALPHESQGCRASGVQERRAPSQIRPRNSDVQVLE